MAVKEFEAYGCEDSSHCLCVTVKTVTLPLKKMHDIVRAHQKWCTSCTVPII